MTTLRETRERCCVCGATGKYTLVTSTNSFGAADLDTRPPQMKRSTMPYWIRRCPSCGYCAPEVSTASDLVKETVYSEAYQQLVNDASYPELANRFRGWAMIQESMGSDIGPGWAYVHAAWACDDAGKADAAIACRLKAVELFRRAEAQGASFAGQAGAQEAILADLLRRSGDFSQAIEVSQEGLRKEPEEVVRRVLSYEIELAHQNDTKCHSIADAFKGA